jgi:hypothetical protein
MSTRKERMYVEIDVDNKLFIMAYRVDISEKSSEMSCLATLSLVYNQRDRQRTTLVSVPTE